MDTVFKVENLDLYYGEKHALKNINIDIYKNKVTAFIGPSGCGKSTLLRCFDRMNDLIDECKITGLISYEEKDIKQMNPIELRTEVGMVFQNPNPFPMSIFDNVAYGPRCQGIKNKATLTKIVVESLKKAALYDEVSDRLKDSALSLSGGQQQRLCIARALVKKAKILILDDSSSALDYATDAKLRHALLNFDKSLTTFIISQRTSSLMHCDQILVLDNGELVGVGTHEELLKNCEVYQEIHNSQFSSEVK